LSSYGFFKSLDGSLKEAAKTSNSSDASPKEASKSITPPGERGLGRGEGKGDSRPNERSASSPNAFLVFGVKITDDGVLLSFKSGDEDLERPLGGDLERSLGGDLERSLGGDLELLEGDLERDLERPLNGDLE
tara:strand:- start:172 stop:570 length:399 start_codon:yes stop_codon:yes gene_type:complete